MSPPADLTAAISLSATFARPSSRPKKTTVVSGGSDLTTGSITLMSAAFQRSTPSTITNRRPIAKVIADSAAATASTVAASPSKTSIPCDPLSRSASARSLARRSPSRPWSSP